LCLLFVTVLFWVMILYLPEKSVCALSISSLSEGCKLFIFPEGRKQNF